MFESIRIPEMDSSYNETQQMDKLKNKLLRDPMVTLGLIATTGILGYGAYSIKNSKGRRLSLQLIHLRLAAQGTFVGFLTLGLIHSLCKRHTNLFEKKN